MRYECLKKSRKKFKVGDCKNGKPKLIWHYNCAHCNEWFRDYQVEVDHIEEVGAFNGNFDEYVRRMYCDLDNLQVLCAGCHALKTKGFMARKDFKRKFKE